MKKTKLMGLATLLLALGVVGCGESEDKTPDYQSDKTYHWVLDAEGNVDKESKVKHTYEEVSDKAVAATCKTEGKKVEKCTVCGYEKETKINTLDHVLEVDATASKTATCAEAGKTVEKCKNCDYVKETPIDKTAHTFGTATIVHDKAEGTASKLSKATCSVCHKDELIVDALSYVSTGGDSWGNKDSSGATLKMSKNGNYVEYKITVDKAYAGMEVALYGWVDFWKDGTNNNDQRGHIVSGSATFSVTVNGTDVPVTNTKTFEEMGMTAGENGNGSFTLCPLGGTTNLVAGENTIRYTRVGSYNLNITEIHFIG